MVEKSSLSPALSSRRGEDAMPRGYWIIIR